MKNKEIIDLFISITEKARTLQGLDGDDVEAEVLHSSMTWIIKGFTEEEYNRMPIYLRKTIEKIENMLLKYVTDEYKRDYEQYIEENGKFRMVRGGLMSKCKQRIGFQVADENSQKEG